MATVTITGAAGGEFGAQARKLAKAIEKLAAPIPDLNATGASCVLTIDNGTGFAKVTISGGPYTDTVGVTV